MEDGSYQRLRLLPLNLVAGLKLKELGAVQDSRALPVFQLMVWGLANGTWPNHSRAARELLRLHYLPDQKAAFEYLVDKVPGGLPALHRRLLRLPPRGAAGVLLEILDMRLKADPKNPYPLGPTPG